MNKTSIIAIAIMSGLTLFADVKARGLQNMTPERRAEARARAQMKMYERTGGYLMRELKDPRVIAFVNENNAADKQVLEKVASVIRNAFSLEVVICTKRPDNAGVVIEFNNSDYPATFITAAENGYGMLNVSKLKTDNPDAEKFKLRLQKEVWRVFVYALGGGNDSQPKCLMKPIASLKELDALESLCPCPMSSGAITSGAARFGVQPRIRVSYRLACEEGWAPAPTNAVQKAIWDKVHAIPKKPIKIEFDPKKGR